MNLDDRKGLMSRFCRVVDALFYLPIRLKKAKNTTDFEAGQSGDNMTLRCLK